MKIFSPPEIKILVVDDNADIRQATARLLGKAGYQVTQAAGGEEALAEVRRQRPDLLLTDRDMPGMDGIEVCRQIKQNPDLKGCLVVMISATYAGTEQQSVGLESGADGYIARPIANRELLARVDAFVRILSLTRSLQEHIEQLEKAGTIANQTQMASLNLMEDAVEAREKLQVINQELRDNEFLLQEAQRLAKLGSYALDLASGRWISSAVLDDIFGIDAAYERSVAGWAALVHPADRAMMMEHFEQEVLNRRRPFDKEYRIVRPIDQGERWVHGLGRPEFDAQGRPMKMIGTIQDITRRKQIEETLRRSQQLQAAAEKLGHVGGWEFDLATRHLTWTDMVYTIHELEPGQPVTVEQAIQYYAPASRPLIKQAVQQAIERGEAFDLELQIITAKGNLRVVHTIGHWDLARGLVFGFFQDITDRVKAEETRTRLAAIVEYSQDAIIGLDLNNTITNWNRGAEKLLGWNEGEIVGQPILRLIPSDRHMEEKQIVAILKDDKALEHFETVRLTKDGRKLDVSITASPIKNTSGQIVGLSKVCRDISPRKRAEARVALLAKAIEQAAETVVITDVNGIINYANPAFEKTTGYACAEAVGQNPRILKSGKQGVEFYRQMWETLLRGEVWTGHFLNKRKDGAMYEEEATISPIRNDEGKITNFVAVKRDVSREAQLERQITEIQKMEAIGQLAGGVAHDYNNILAATNIQLGMLMMDKTLTPEILEALKDLRRGSDRAASLTRQLLLFSRRQAMQIKPVELNTLLDDVLKMIRRVIGEHIDLNIQSQTQAAWIEADSGMIEQVVMNLAINARDAMPNGGKLTIRINELVISPQDIRNPEARTDHFISLTVADEGCGMSEEIQSRISEPFFTTKGVGKGTGLGLATVYGIVKQHRGWIEVSSKIGKGSVFQVLLPKGGSQTSVTAEHTQPPIMDGTGTILVVEDEDSVRRPLVLFLKLAGYQVFEAENGAEALKLWGGRLNLINLLLTDMVMPGGMNGKQLADSFKKSKPDLPVIITSGYSTEISNFGFNEEYGFRFLAKPYQTNALLKIVQQCLGSKK